MSSEPVEQPAQEVCPSPASPAPSALYLHPERAALAKKHAAERAYAEAKAAQLAQERLAAGLPPVSPRAGG